MTYREYQKLESQRTKIISQRRSLQMTIRMNHAWLTNPKSIRGQKRLAIIADAEQQLADLPPVPPKPEQPIGYQVLDQHGDYIGFWATDDIASVIEDLTAQHGEISKTYTLNPKPRYRD